MSKEKARRVRDRDDDGGGSVTCGDVTKSLTREDERGEGEQSRGEERNQMMPSRAAFVF